MPGKRAGSRRDDLGRTRPGRRRSLLSRAGKVKKKPQTLSRTKLDSSYDRIALERVDDLNAEAATIQLNPRMDADSHGWKGRRPRLLQKVKSDRLASYSERLGPKSGSGCIRVCSWLHFSVTAWIRLKARARPPWRCRRLQFFFGREPNRISLYSRLSFRRKPDF